MTRGEIQKLIAERKERLNLIQAEILFQEFVDNPFFFAELPPDIKEAKEYNDETDREILRMFENY